MTGMPMLLSIRAAAEALEVHENTIRNWCDSGVLGFERVGPYRRIPSSEVERLLDMAKIKGGYPHGDPPPSWLAIRHENIELKAKLAHLVLVTRKRAPKPYLAGRDGYRDGWNDAMKAVKEALTNASNG